MCINKTPNHTVVVTMTVYIPISISVVNRAHAEVLVFLPGSLVYQPPLEPVTLAQLQLLVIRGQEPLDPRVHLRQEGLLVLGHHDGRPLTRLQAGALALPSLLLTLPQRVRQLGQLAGAQVADPLLEQFVEVKVLVDQKVDAGGLAEEPRVRGAPGARAGPHVEVVGSALIAVTGLDIVERA